MNKNILIIAGILITNQSFATNLTGTSASCDSGVLGAEEGGVALRATFEPESIELRWYDNDKNLISVSNEQSSCTYGAGINVPTAPQRTGYKFNGWKVINIFSTLNTTTNGLHRYGKGYSNSDNLCIYDGNTVTCDSSFDDLAMYQWKTLFSYGTIYGHAKCSNISGAYTVTGDPGTTSGQYCWCLGTGYKPNGSDVIYSPSSPLSWVASPDTDHGSVSYCRNRCAYTCARYIYSTTSFRKTLFGQSGS